MDNKHGGAVHRNATEGLGHLRGVKVHITRIVSVEPKFCKVRPVPYAYRKKVEGDIEKLLHLGVLKPVSHSEWVIPVVHVFKPISKIRLCEDFKLTAYKAIEIFQYPLPNAKDLFSSFSGGASFSKIDLRGACCQLELYDSAREVLVIDKHLGLFRYTRLPFGVASAPAKRNIILQFKMNRLNTR